VKKFLDLDPDQEVIVVKEFGKLGQRNNVVLDVV